MTEIETLEMLREVVDSFPDSDSLTIAIREAIKVIIRSNADGCQGCAFGDVEEWEMPCAKCKRNSKDYWRASDGRT